MGTVQCRINPFKQSENNNLHSITTGTEASDDNSTDLARAYEVGDEAFQQFCRERLILCPSGKKDIFATISQQKLKTFDSMSSVSRSKALAKIIQLKGDRELFLRLLVIGQTKNIEVKELLKFTDVVISTCDTDIAIIGLNIIGNFVCKLFIYYESKFISLAEMRLQLGEQLCDILIELHVFTGCDTASAFYFK